MKILKQTHCMIDLETASTDPTAAIFQIGAVIFRFDDGIKEEFLVNVDMDDCKSFGLDITKSCLDWWKQQPKHVIKSLFNPKPIPLHDAFTQLFDFYTRNQAQHPWSHGAGFDLPIIEHAANKVGLQTPWHYSDCMCNRTVLAILDINNKKLADQDENAHNALSDARRQANVLINAFKEDK